MLEMTGNLDATEPISGQGVGGQLVVVHTDSGTKPQNVEALTRSFRRRRL